MFVLTHAIVLSAPDNHEYDEIEQRVVCHMRQAIFWSFREEVLLPVMDTEGKPTDEYRMTSDFVIRDYITLKIGWSNKQNVRWNLINGKWHFTFYDMNSDTNIRVICGSMKITHTDYDVESEHRKILKRNFRHEFMERRK